MTRDKEQELSELFPKGAGSKFAIILAFLLLLSISLAAVFHINIPHDTPQNIFILGVKLNVDIVYPALFFIGISMAILSFIFSIYCVSKKNYSLAATAGCALLIIAHLGFLSQNQHLILVAQYILFSAFALLIPAINESLCQMGSPQTANRRLCLAYAFIPLFLLILPEALRVLDEHVSIGIIIIKKLYYTSIFLLILILWLSSLRKKVWHNTNIEAKSSTHIEQPKTYTCTTARIVYILLLILWQIMIFCAVDACILKLFLLCTSIAGFIACYWPSNRRCAAQILRIGQIILLINFILIIAMQTALIADKIGDINILDILILSNAAIIPFCLTYCLRIMLENPHTQRKRWIHFCLYLNFPLSYIYVGLFLFVFFFR